MALNWNKNVALNALTTEERKKMSQKAKHLTKRYSTFTSNNSLFIDIHTELSCIARTFRLFRSRPDFEYVLQLSRFCSSLAISLILLMCERK